MRGTWGRATVVGLASTLIIGACSGPAETERTTDPSTTTSPPSLPSTTTSTEASVADLVVIGDSFVAWADWPEMLAADLSEARDRGVVLDDSLSAPGILAQYEPDRLRSDDDAISRVANADLLILQPRAFMAPDAMAAFVAETCGGPSNTDCLRAAIVEMRAYVDDYLDLVVDIASEGSEVIVVIVGSWPVDGTYPHLRATDPEKHGVLATFMFDISRQAEESALEHGIDVVDVGRIFNGPAYLDAAPGEFLVEDRIHLSEAGSRAVADAVAAVLSAG